MKTSVEYVAARYGEEVRPVRIRDDEGNLKYHLLIKLWEGGVLVKNDAAWRAFGEMAKAYEKLPKAQKRVTAPTPKPAKTGNGPGPMKAMTFNDVLDDLHLEMQELH